MSRSRENNLFTISHLFRYKFPTIAICVTSLATPWSLAQKASSSPPPSAVTRTCDGKTPPQEAAHQSPADQPPGAGDKNALKLSTRGGADESADPQGQFCRRDRSGQTPLRPSVTSPQQEENAQPSQSTTPIAELRGGKLIIRASGQDFDSVLEAIRSVSGFTVEMPPGGESEPVFLKMGPVSITDALVALVSGTKYNYFIVGSAKDPQIVKHLILTERTAAPEPLVASSQSPPPGPQATLYGAQGVQSDADAEVSEPPPPPVPTQPAEIPSSVPTGINIQKLAAESGKTPGQVLDELQKRQQQVLDDQATSQSQSAPQ